MKKVTTVLTAATLAVASGAALAWGNGYSDGWGYGPYGYAPDGFGAPVAPPVGMSKEQQKAIADQQARIAEQQKAFAQQQAKFIEDMQKAQQQAAEYYAQHPVSPVVPYGPGKDFFAQMDKERQAAIDESNARYEEYKKASDEHRKAREDAYKARLEEHAKERAARRAEYDKGA